MSNAPQGPGWWMAQDGKWYPPQTTQVIVQRDNRFWKAFMWLTLITLALPILFFAGCSALVAIGVSNAPHITTPRTTVRPRPSITAGTPTTTTIVSRPR